MKPPAFQFYADDFLAGVADMTQAEVGAYILLLCHQWSRGEIPIDPQRVPLIAKGETTEHVLAKFPNGKNTRLEAERQKQAEYREAQSERGKVGAARRWDSERHSGGHSGGHASANGTGIAQASIRQWQNDGSPSPSPSPSSVSVSKGECTLNDGALNGCSAGAEPAAKKAKAPKPPEQSDADWLTDLAADPAYAHADVANEHRKMVRWCETNRKQPSRRRFVNWLNRIERPMNAAPKSRFADAF